MAPRVGLVLGGGGITGTAFHGGVLGALQQHAGWDARTAEIIVGTSAGSITALMLRSDYPPLDLIRRALGEPLSPEAQRIADRVPFPEINPAKVTGKAKWPASPNLLAAYAKQPRSARIGGIAASLLPTGRNSPQFIRESIDALTGGLWPSQSTWVCALELTRGNREVFGRDTMAAQIGEAVAASCAIPGYFAPVTIGDSSYVDGAMWSATNLDVLVDQGLDAVVVISPMSTATSVSTIADLPFRKALSRQVRAEAKKVRSAGTKVFIFEPTRDDLSAMGLNLMDISREAPVGLQAKLSVADRLARKPEIAAALTGFWN